MTKDEIIKMVDSIDSQLQNEQKLDSSTIKLLTDLRMWWIDKLFYEHGIPIGRK